MCGATRQVGGGPVGTEPIVGADDDGTGAGPALGVC
jgi:hypothetical protein